MCMLMWRILTCHQFLCTHAMRTLWTTFLTQFWIIKKNFFLTNWPRQMFLNFHSSITYSTSQFSQVKSLGGISKWPPGPIGAIFTFVDLADLLKGLVLCTAFKHVGIIIRPLNVQLFFMWLRYFINYDFTENMTYDRAPKIKFAQVCLKSHVVTHFLCNLSSGFQIYTQNWNISSGSRDMDLVPFCTL